MAIVTLQPGCLMTGSGAKDAAFCIEIKCFNRKVFVLFILFYD
jgi:hypothetical protein